MPSLTGGPDFFLSLYWVKAKWSVGWSVANVSKGNCPRSTIDSSRHSKTSKWTNTNYFLINQNHPRHPQTPLTEPQKIQDFQLFCHGSKRVCFHTEFYYICLFPSLNISFMLLTRQHDNHQFVNPNWPEVVNIYPGAPRASRYVE